MGRCLRFQLVESGLTFLRNAGDHAQRGGQFLELQPRPQPGDGVVRAGLAGDFRYDLGFHGDIGLLLNGGNLLQGVQPRFTLSYDFGGSWIGKASYGIFTQKLITVSNEDDLISLFDAWVLLPDNLHPEEARHYVLGIEGNIVPGLATSLQGYIKDYRSLTLYNSNKVFPDDPDYRRSLATSLALRGLVRTRSGHPAEAVDDRRRAINIRSGSGNAIRRSISSSIQTVVFESQSQ